MSIKSEIGTKLFVRVSLLFEVSIVGGMDPFRVSVQRTINFYRKETDVERGGRHGP